VVSSTQGFAHPVFSGACHLGGYLLPAIVIGIGFPLFFVNFHLLNKSESIFILKNGLSFFIMSIAQFSKILLQFCSLFAQLLSLFLSLDKEIIFLLNLFLLVFQLLLE
jgi:hypothetical protein